MKKDAIDKGDVLTIAETAEILRVGIGTIYRAIKSGQLRTWRIGRTIRIRREDIEALFYE